MTYTVSATDANSPLDDDFPASNVALELRLLKARINQLETDFLDSLFPPGMIVAFAGSTNIIPGFIALPTVPLNVPRVGGYSRLFTAIGTTWGDGDGTTTFGLPYVELGSTLIRASSGTITDGTAGAHTHFYEDGFCVNQNSNPVYAGENLPTISVDVANQWEFGGIMHRRRLETETSGTGDKNKAAGTGVLFFIKI